MNVNIYLLYPPGFPPCTDIETDSLYLVGDYLIGCTQWEPCSCEELRLAVANIGLYSYCYDLITSISQNNCLLSNKNSTRLCVVFNNLHHRTLSAEE